MHKPKSVLENETPKNLLNFELQLDHPLSARRPNLALISKKKKELVYFRLCRSGGP